MNIVDVMLIEQQIDYLFNNKGLLFQAFTRKSNAQENNCTSNELLEFLGDEVLDFFVTKMLSDYYGKLAQNTNKSNSTSKIWFLKNNISNMDVEYITDDNLSEKDFTEIKKRIVDNKNLASIIEGWGFQKYLFLGKGDIEKQVQNETKVKADLFEALIGAITIDSNWNFKVLENSIKYMLNIDFDNCNDLINDDNYVSIIQHWWQSKIGGLPKYTFSESNPLDSRFTNTYSSGYICSIELTHDGYIIRFDGNATTKSEARYKCAEKLFKYLEKNNLLYNIYDDAPSEEELDMDNAINTLQELAQKGWCSMPIYTYYDEPTYNDNGDPRWSCKCTLESEDIGWTGTCESKKDAKKYSAYLCLIEMLKYKNKYE